MPLPEALRLQQAQQPGGNKQFTIEKLEGKNLKTFVDSFLSAYINAAIFGENARNLIKALEGCKAKITEKERQNRNTNEIFAYILKDQKETPAGILAIEKDPDGEECIYWIVLREDIQGQGIGTWLTQQAIIDMQRRAVSSVYTMAVTEASQTLFKKLGFTGRDYKLRRQLELATA